MTTPTGRAGAIAAIVGRTPAESTVNFSDESPKSVFGSNTFSLAVMKETLKPDTYESLLKTIQSGSKLSEAVADEVADAMRVWATSKGATHYAHVFYPLTGATAESARLTGLAVTPLGTQPAPPTSWRVSTERRCAFPLPSCRGRVKPSTPRLRCLSRCSRSTSRPAGS